MICSRSSLGDRQTDSFVPSNSIHYNAALTDWLLPSLSNCDGLLVLYSLPKYKYSVVILVIVIVIMKFYVTSLWSVIVIFNFFGFVGAQEEGVITRSQEEGQKGNKPECKDDVLRNLLDNVVGHETSRSGKQGKGKAEKCGACNMNLDYCGVCENQPFFYYHSPKDGGFEVCERLANSLDGTGSEALFGGYLEIYDFCPSFPMNKTYRTAEECYNSNIAPGKIIKIFDACNQELPSMTNPLLSSKSKGKGKKECECKLNISDCDRVCDEDMTAYYLSKYDDFFWWPNDRFGFSDDDEFPTLVGGCLHFTKDEIEFVR